MSNIRYQILLSENSPVSKFIKRYAEESHLSLDRAAREILLMLFGIYYFNQLREAKEANYDSALPDNDRTADVAEYSPDANFFNDDL